MQQKQLAQQQLREEQERQEFEEMQLKLQREIQDLENRRSVHSLNLRNMVAEGDKSRKANPRQRMRTKSRGGKGGSQAKSNTTKICPPLNNEQKVNIWLQSSEDLNAEGGYWRAEEYEMEPGHETSMHHIRASRHKLDVDIVNVNKHETGEFTCRKQMEEGHTRPGDYIQDRESKEDYQQHGARPKKKEQATRPPSKKSAARGKPMTPRYLGNEPDEDEGEEDYYYNSVPIRTERDKCDRESVRSWASGDRNREVLKSGFLDKPCTVVIAKQIWPHMNQNPRYVTTALTFNQLNFCQFVGGECRTILKTSDEEEVYGRLRVLSKVAYLYDQCRDWDRARAAYFAMVSSIEEGEASWSSTFGHYDMMCPPKWEEPPTRGDRQDRSKFNNKVQKREFYCRDFQKGECSSPAPHRGWVKNGYENVDHFCFPCFRAKLGKLGHVPNSDDCGQKKMTPSGTPGP